MTRSNACDLILAAPGLAGAAPQWFERAGLLPEVPSLTRLLARAEQHPSPLATPAREGALTLFGLELHTAPEPPWAALAQAGDAERPEPGCWLRIDPVHLRPDMAQLLLFTQPDVTLDRDEAKALAAIVAESLAELGDFQLLHPGRWYLRLHDETPLETVAPERVAGRDVRDAMPAGEAGRLWRTLINEIQMQLFEHPVNQRREAQGLPAVNSVWPWGWGRAPSVPAARYRSVTADSPEVRGLARLGEVEQVQIVAAFPEWSARIAGPGEHLVWLEPDNPRTADEPGGWGAWLAALERDWFAPLEQALRERRLRNALLHTGDGQAWRLTHGGLRRFWRRPTSLGRRLRLQVTP